MASSLLKVLLVFVVFLTGCGATNTTVSTLTVSPTSATVGVNQSQAFYTIAKNSYGQIIAASVTWSVTGGIGSITTTGIFTAGFSTGEGAVVATSGAKTAQSSLTLTNNGWIAGRVTGEKDSGGVQNILVTLRNHASLYDRTDSSGDYSISAIPAGTYEVYTAENNQIYLSSSIEVTVASGETKAVNFYLTARSDLTDFPDVPEF